MSPTQMDHPRIRGEHRPRGFRSAPGPGSSPHTRGALDEIRVGDGSGGIIPAYAGSTSTPAPPIASPRDHPRIRGEHPSEHSRTPGSSGSSPHTRGAHPPAVRRRPHRRIIPAYAGSTRRRTASGWKRRDHPRIRGEHRSSTVSGRPSHGSSPHTRGALYWMHRIERKDQDHPRIRGEHIHSVSSFPPYGGSSPHTRGALDRVRRHLHDIGIIPAYAGSTALASHATSVSVDHPRIRGEHSSRKMTQASRAGSSPHTRGAPSQRVQAHKIGWIIPAYAGSTHPTPDGPHRRRDHPRIRGEH